VGLIAVSLGMAATLPAEVSWSTILRGFSEALVPAFFNFGMLAAAWLLVAVGMLRRARDADVP
jgi:hypothetical protein